MKLILLIGIAASGKTTLSNKLVAKGFLRICADDIRGELYGDQIIQGDSEEVFSIFNKRLEEMLSTGKDIVVDNTNLYAKHRKPIVDAAKNAGYSDIQMWILDVPLATCLERNAARERKVPEDVIATRYNDFNRQGRPQRSEGKIVLIRPGKDADDYRFFPQN